MIEYIGYHATETSRIYSITSKGFRHQQGWLGFGAYFFEADTKIAQSWGERKYPTSPISILKATIKLTQLKHIFDVRQPNSSDSLLFAKERSELIEAMKVKGLVFKKPSRDFDALIFNSIKKNYSKKIIIHNTYTFVKAEKGFPPSYVCNGTEICISDNTLIKSLEVLK